MWTHPPSLNCDRSAHVTANKAEVTAKYRQHRRRLADAVQLVR
jgi:hypothetical protein